VLRNGDDLPMKEDLGHLLAVQVGGKHRRRLALVSGHQVPVAVSVMVRLEWPI
jgi:hypothetical protein